MSAGATVAPLRSMLLVGRGDGPGVGMGQWGAFGYSVRYHFGYRRILAHFYGGTRTSTLSSLGKQDDPVIKVVILENFDLATNLGYDPLVTSASSFRVVGQSGEPGPSPGPSPGTVPTTTLPGTLPTTTTATTLLGTTTTTTALPVTTTTTALPSTTTTTAPPGTTTTSSSVLAGSGQETGSQGASGTGATPASSPPRGPVLSVSAGMAIDLRLEPDGTWSAFEGGTCGQAAEGARRDTRPVATGLVDPIVEPPSTAASAPPSRLLTLCRHDDVDETLRGAIEAYDRQGYERTLNLVHLDSYLEGVLPAEVSASWGADGSTAGAPGGRPFGFQALEAQAVAARSFVLASTANGGWEGYADICDTALCQAYVGVDYEQPSTSAAVGATRGQVQVRGPGAGAVVLARYSASTGGWTAPSAFPAVPDLGDACVVPGDPLECNPRHAWTATVSGAALDRAFRGLGRIVAIRVVRRDHKGALGGRALLVSVVGTKRHKLVGAGSFAGALGLYSNWFAIARIARVPGHRTTPATPTSSGVTPTSSGVPPTSSRVPPTSSTPTSPAPSPPSSAGAPTAPSSSVLGAPPPTAPTTTTQAVAPPPPTPPVAPVASSPS